MIKKILVPLDGSEVALSVLPTVAEIAQKLDASLILFHAINPIVGTFPGTETWSADPRFLDDQKQAAEQFLGRAAEELKGKGLDVATLVAIGPSVDTIVRAAEENEADLIAIGTHGHSGIKRWVIGSVADAVLRRTHLPCLLLRPADTGKS
jgi:nucleotide-binding universal stress UspA family protein